MLKTRQRSDTTHLRASLRARSWPSSLKVGSATMPGRVGTTGTNELQSCPCRAYSRTHGVKLAATAAHGQSITVGQGRDKSGCGISLAPRRRGRGLAGAPRQEAGRRARGGRRGRASPGPGGRNFLKGFCGDGVKEGSRGPWQPPLTTDVHV